MSSILYVIAIMGCADDSNECRSARVEPATYTSIQSCQAAMPAALVRNTDLSFPTIAAACQQQGAQMARNEAQRPTRGG
ncbi:hypothetical protein [Sphingomonas sp. 3-13AW]|jgi:putative N-acetylmannosamine-6-phosphate epimerase|uniref:hypothetical protein n=1 Tax=Sphingomonas sp. 3-13AW TaxID=3050450 RepID=UPI003BB71C59